MRMRHSSALAKLGHLRHSLHLKDTPKQGESDDGWDTINFTINNMVEKCGPQVRVRVKGRVGL